MITCSYQGDNREFEPATVRQIVRDPQFRAGYRDYLGGRPPKPLYYDPGVGERRDTWGYERGRLVACWLLATGQQPPNSSDTERLAKLYREAKAQDVIL
jgi:hypothetical protein